MRDAPKVFSIPAGAPFLDVLADAFLTGRLAPLPEPRDDPLALANATILLPTRRAVRALRERLVETLGADAAILPDIRPIGDASEEDHLLDPSAETVADRLALPPAIGRLPRQLALTQLTLAWGRAIRGDSSLLDIHEGEQLLIPASAADAARLAGDLARLMDDVETATDAGAGRDPWAEIQKLAPEDHAGYFQITLDFLKIAFERWPEYLAENGVVDPAVRRDHLIRAEAARLERMAARGPVIAAGSTGSIPATAELLKTIAHLPNGAVVLPALDRDLDADGFAAIGGVDTPARAYGHPQFGLKQLIAALGITREDVAPLGDVPEALALRARLATEALRPAETTDTWAMFRAAGPDIRAVDAALADAGLIVAHNEQEEAVAIAIAIREAVEQPEARVALVTPDRTLARRVAAELGRWGLAIDDSAGARLDLLPEGIFARLVGEALVADTDPAALLAVLKHPSAVFGMGRAECRKAARILELAVFRGRRGDCGLAGLADALAAAREEAGGGAARHVPRARKRLAPGDWDLAARLVERLGAILGPVSAAFAGDAPFDSPEAAMLLREAIAAATTDHTGSDDGFRDRPGGVALARLLEGLIDGPSLAMKPAEFPPFLATLMTDVSVTRPPGTDPRIHIWGTLEARLQTADLLILGGLDEGVWPAETRTDPWLSRAMRAEIGLPPPERRIGQAAHDFMQAFAAPRVLVTRAGKRGGTPTVASRWLQRFDALVGKAASERMTSRGALYVDLARQVDRWDKPPQPIRKPEPKPAIADRPRSLSVTEIETLVRDPYAIYAKHVLRLDPLDPLGQAPDYALRGSLIHEAIGDFSQAWIGLPFDDAARKRLIEFGEQALTEIEAFADLHAIWKTRFEGIATWLINWEAKRDPDIELRSAEIDGRLEIDAPAGVFALRGRADRIDLRKDGGVEILDFKTGTPPSARQVLVGFAPQLALEAAMVQAGAFDQDGKPSFRTRSIANLGWIALGQVERGQPIRSAVEDGFTADEVAAEAHARLEALVAAYDDPDRGYASRARPMFQLRYESPYDHLARVREWALVESDEDIDWLPPRKP
ncbi:double-strand break repair protein AddB [Bauldia litoralis]|uniref:ATP-dependent helicase/nuclease subunit B n=1 Tax=Bauldia litoralis TaxID=665467 RepID=A0A1G6EGS4_9HYPH|nr:double-strand break repair protein AddB [Bauldia litoralis]SDB56626.1 ATP-dependent helicase/nuclease subunit B [Bauldia litoralis]